MQHHNRAKYRRELAAEVGVTVHDELAEREPAAGVVTVQADGHLVTSSVEIDAELLPSDDEGEDEDGYDEETDIEDADVVEVQPVSQELAVRDPFKEWELRLAELRIEQRIHDAIAWEDKALELLREGKVAELADHIAAGVDLIDPPVRRRRAPEVKIAPDIAERYNVAAMMSGRFDDTAINAATAARATVDEAGPYLSALMEPFEATDENIFGAASTR